MITESELVWVARYIDGSIHTQYNEDGSYKDKYADIVRSQLRSFELWRGEKLVLAIHFDTPDKKLIYRRRVFKPSDGPEYTVYLVGWQITTGGENIQSISLVFPDDHVEVIGKWNKNNPLYEAPIVHPHEGEDWQ